jgi:hypothetical protein
LKSYKTRWTAELEDPVHAGAARRETLPFRGYYNPHQPSSTIRNHGCDGVYFGVDIMRAKHLFDIATSKNYAFV